MRLLQRTEFTNCFVRTQFVLGRFPRVVIRYAHSGKRSATILNLQDDTVLMYIIDRDALEIRLVAPLEHAQETVWTEDGEIVSVLTAASNTPSIKNLGVWSNGIGPWLGLAIAAINLIYCGGFAGVTEIDFYLAGCQIGMRTDMQLVWYRARGPHAWLLRRQRLVDRGNRNVIRMPGVIRRNVSNGTGKRNLCGV